MLILSRSVGQKIRIYPRPSLAGDTPISEVFKDGAIEIVLINVSKIRNGVTQAHIGIEVHHPDFAIARGELENGKRNGDCQDAGVAEWRTYVDFNSPLANPCTPIEPPRMTADLHPTRRLLARRLRLLRAGYGWSQETLATLSGLHRTYISSIERMQRNVGLDNLEKIARAFEITVRELFKED